METFRLNDGTAVLGRTDRDGNALGHPFVYTNRTQAQRKVDELRSRGFAARIYQPRLGPAFYVAFE